MNRRTFLRTTAVGWITLTTAAGSASAAKTKWTQSLVVSISFDDSTISSTATQLTVDIKQNLYATPLRALQTLRSIAFTTAFDNRFLRSINGVENQITGSLSDMCWLVYAGGQSLDLDQRGKIVLAPTEHTLATTSANFLRLGIAFAKLENLPVLVSPRLAAAASSNPALAAKLRTALKKYRNGAPPQLTFTFRSIAQPHR